MRLFAPWTLARATRVVRAKPEAAVKKVRRSIIGVLLFAGDIVTRNEHTPGFVIRSAGSIKKSRIEPQKRREKMLASASGPPIKEVFP